MITRISPFFLKSAGFALIASFLPLLCGVCQAVPILPGGVQLPAPVEPDPVGASLVFSTGPINFAAGTFAGTLRSSVWNNDASNPYGLSRLTFTYEIVNDVDSPDDIGRLTVTDFSLFSTDTSYRPNDNATAPSSIKRSANGSVVAFNFDTPGLAAGSISTLLVVQTDAEFYQPSLASLIDGSVVSVASLGPSTIVPEPASLAMFGLGGIGLLLIAMRRRLR